MPRFRVYAAIKQFGEKTYRKAMQMAEENTNKDAQQQSVELPQMASNIYIYNSIHRTTP